MIAPLPDGAVIVAGSGIAGLVTALSLAPRPVLLVTRAGLGQASSTLLAQGGIAASIGADDAPALHLADTLAAGAGLCDRQTAGAILAEARRAIDMLIGHGVAFDRDPDGSLSLGLEAAHARRRILHAHGDGTGRAMIEALRRAVRSCPSITVLEHAEIRRLTTAAGAISGVIADIGGVCTAIPCPRVVLATGGIGGLFQASTNPSGNFGAGLALALRAGAVLGDMEFVQFHPTALATGRQPLSLVSEAVRGEGAILLNDRGERFMAGFPGAELAPRDIVARAIHAQITAGRGVFLDARTALGDGFAARFPGIAALCRADGIDPARDLIPVCPAAHYHMGGIRTDAAGRSAVPGLWAVGECAATGLHGANRLASNSLLEAAVMATRAAADIAEAPISRQPASMAAPQPLPAPDPEPVRALISRHLGIERDAAGLRTAIAELLPLALSGTACADPALVGLSIAVFAHQRRESRGAQMRRDFPQAQPGSQRRHMGLEQILAVAHGLATPAFAKGA